jgi:hypothetical protein
MIFAVISMTISILALLLSTKRLSNIEIYATTFFALYLDLLTDVFLAFKYHLFGYFSEGIEWVTAPYIIVTYSSVSYLFLNYFPYKKDRLKQLFYFLGWTLFSIIYEKAAQSTKLFFYHEWKLWYSAILYPFLFLLLLINLKLIRRFIRQIERKLPTD